MKTLLHYLIFGFLTLTAGAKGMTLFMPVKRLYRIDNLLGIQEWKLMVIATLIETALILALGLRLRQRYLYIALFGTIILIYRSFNLLFDIQGACPCAGNYTDWLNLDPEGVGFLLWLVAGLFIIGGIYLEKHTPDNIVQV